MRFAPTRSCLVAAVVAVLGILSHPSIAHAHGVGGVPPTNYTSVVDVGSPGISEVTVKTIDLGTRLELVNRGTTTLVVIGYENEPYLRVGPDGAFENRRSPTTYLNRTITPSGPPPSNADASATPEWRKLSDAPVLRWHDHRAHWMGSTPKVVTADPNTAHQLTTWEIPIRDGTQDLGMIRGTISWVPPSSPWPWILLAIVLALALAGCARLVIGRLTWIGALAMSIATELVVTFGAYTFSVAPLMSRLFANIYNIAGVLVAAVALFATLRRDKRAVAPLVLIAGLVLALGTGLPGFGELTASQLPTTLPTPLARCAIALAIGLGIGLAAAAAQFLRPEGTSTPRQTTTPRQIPSTVETKEHLWSRNASSSGSAPSQQ
ncbi:MAG: hypothetical protein ACOYN3_08635 [Acidimicrobiia bacterium]